jgi:hypothetical protein
MCPPAPKKNKELLKGILFTDVNAIPNTRNSVVRLHHFHVSGKGKKYDSGML